MGVVALAFDVGRLGEETRYLVAHVQLTDQLALKMLLHVVHHVVHHRLRHAVLYVLAHYEEVGTDEPPDDVDVSLLTRRQLTRRSNHRAVEKVDRMMMAWAVVMVMRGGALRWHVLRSLQHPLLFVGRLMSKFAAHERGGCAVNKCSVE